MKYNKEDMELLERFNSASFDYSDGNISIVEFVKRMDEYLLPMKKILVDNEMLEHEVRSIISVNREEANLYEDLKLRYATNRHKDINGSYVLYNAEKYYLKSDQKGLYFTTRRNEE
jgi:hypothetical protein